MKNIKQQENNGGGGSKDYKLIFYCDSRKMWAWKSPNICFCVLKKQIVSEKFQ